MDRSITLVTPAMHRRRGADAFDRGEPITAHNMNEGAPAILDWQAGWLERQRKQQKDHAWAARELMLAQAAGCPP